jgi:hypothetical protein
MRGEGLFLGLFAGLALMGVAGCENGYPAAPTYTNDIEPIMLANCVRCHGAGGTLNTDPDIPTYPQGDPRASYTGTPHNGYFNSYDDIGAGKLGLHSYATTARVLMNAALPYMPPAPADPLSGWEKQLFEMWLDNPQR